VPSNVKLLLLEVATLLDGGSPMVESRDREIGTSLLE
jgi:hypothetical protein